MKTHPAAEMFPLMTGDKFDSLVADIKERGQEEPIYIFEGKIIDGRNRWRACAQLKLEPWIEKLNKEECSDPFAFVMSMNYHRRHLSPHKDGDVLKAYLKSKGVKKTQPGPKAKGDETTMALSHVAKNLGIPLTTAKRHIKASDDYKALPAQLKEKVDAGEVTPAIARKAVESLPKAASKNGTPKLNPASQAVIDKAAERAKQEAKFYRFIDSTTSGLEHWQEFALKNRWGRTTADGLQRQIKRCKIALSKMEKLK